jgi:hypothetical protein
MSSDQVAEIAPAIREALAGGPDLCATLEVSGTPSSWIQYVGGLVNAAYSSAKDPSDLIAKIGGASLKSWEPEKCITVAMASDDPRTIAKWIDRYFESVLLAQPDYAIDVTLQNL